MEHSSKAKAGAVQFLQLKIFSCFFKKKELDYHSCIHRKKKITVVYIIIVHQGSDRQRLEIIQP